MLIDENEIYLALITLLGTLITGIINLINSYFRHKETMVQIDQVKESVNGKMDKLLVVTGDAREAIGKLKGERKDQEQVSETEESKIQEKVG